MQKLVPRSHVRIFTTSAPDPTHRTLNSCFGAFHSVRVHLGLFRHGSKLGAKRVELVQLMQKVMLRSRVIIFRNEHTRSTPLDPISCFVVFLSVWVHLGPFRYCMKHGAKWAELVQLMQKFVPRSRVGIFRNGRTRSSPQDPKLIFWHVLNCSGANSVQNRLNWSN
jgi:hypothetical protein